MSRDPSSLPKYKLSNPKTDNTDSSAASLVTEKATAQEPPKPPLQLRQSELHNAPKDSMLSTADMLEGAYGAETRTRQRKNIIQKLKNYGLAFLVMCLFFD